MKIKKYMIIALMGVLFSFAAFSVTASAAEADPNAFTPGGSGLVIDNVTEKNGKEFYTIKTENGNIFYLIVDRLRDADNVYFLNAVTESDLIALAEKSGITITPGVVADENSSGGNTGQQQQKQEQPSAQTPSLDSNTTTIIFVAIAVVAVGGIGFYLKIVKPKKNKKNDYDDFDEYEDSEDDDFGGNTRSEPEDDYDSDDDTDNNDNNDNDEDDDLEW